MTTTERSLARESDPDSIAVAIVDAVGAVKDVDPTELDTCLHDVVSPDALQLLIDSPGGAFRRADGVVSFGFEGCAVRVYASGVVEAEPSQTAASRASDGESASPVTESTAGASDPRP
jgi:hypothetical protein